MMSGSISAAMQSASWTGAAFGSCEMLIGAVAVDPLLDEDRRRFRRRLAGGAERLALVEADGRLVRGVERHQRQVGKAGGEDQRRRFRIGPDVEFGRRRDIGDVVPAAHDDHLGHIVDQLREERERGRDVGERPDREPG